MISCFASDTRVKNLLVEPAALDDNGLKVSEGWTELDRASFRPFQVFCLMRRRLDTGNLYAKVMAVNSEYSAGVRDNPPDHVLVPEDPDHTV